MKQDLGFTVFGMTKRQNPFAVPNLRRKITVILGHENFKLVGPFLDPGFVTNLAGMPKKMGQSIADASGIPLLTGSLEGEGKKYASITKLALFMTELASTNQFFRR
jgi:hypothetical protein